MVLAGSAQVGQLTSRAGTPTAVQPGGTGLQHHRAGGDLGVVADR